MRTELHSDNLAQPDEEGGFSVSSTSWGEAEVAEDVEALQRYLQFLTSLNNAGVWIIYVLVAIVCAFSIYLVTTTGFEKVIFYDGSEATCVLDSQTGVIKNVE